MVKYTPFLAIFSQIGRYFNKSAGEKAGNGTDSLKLFINLRFTMLLYFRG